MKTLKLVTILGIITLLTACGGGGGSTPGTEPVVPTQPSGVETRQTFGDWTSSTEYYARDDEYYGFMFTYNIPVEDGETGLEANMQVACRAGQTQMSITLANGVGVDEVAVTTASIYQNEEFYTTDLHVNEQNGYGVGQFNGDAVNRIVTLMALGDLGLSVHLQNGEYVAYVFSNDGLAQAFASVCN